MSRAPLSCLVALLAGLGLTACLTSLPIGGSKPLSLTGNSSPGGGGGGGGGGGAAGTCCIDHAFYACPDAGALDRCSGALARCMTGCAMSDDLACPDRCVQDHPPDPSGCERDVGRDDTCGS